MAFESASSAAGALNGYRFALWLDDEYCPVDAGVLRVLSSVVDRLEHAGARVAEARPCPLREAERLAQRLIQAVFSGAYPAEEYERLRVLAESAAVDDDSPPSDMRATSRFGRAISALPGRRGHNSPPAVRPSSASTTCCCVPSRRQRPSRTTTSRTWMHGASS